MSYHKQSLIIFTQRLSQRLATVFAILFICISIAAPLKATAAVTCPSGMSQTDCAAMLNGWSDWIPDNGATGCATSGTSSTNLVGSDNIQKAFNFLNGKSFKSSTGAQMTVTPAAAAGIVGNLMVESGVNPKINNGGSLSDYPQSTSIAWGIAQWMGSRQTSLVDYAKQHNISPSDLGIQLDFMWTELTGAYNASTLTPASQSGVSAAQAATIVFDHYEVAGDASLPARISDANDVFAKYGGMTSSAPTSGTSGTTSTSTSTTCVSSSSGTSLNGFVEYKQCGQSWSNIAYGGGTVCSSGCGPTSMAMIISTLTQSKVTPDQTANYGAAHGTSYSGGGSYWNVGPVLASHWGLNSKELGVDQAAINQTLQNGGLVLAVGTGPEPFTSAGHFIVIRAVTSSGQWIMGNSVTSYSSTKPYDPAMVLASMANSWAITK